MSQRPSLHVFLVGILAALTYAGTLSHGFTLDDELTVVRNQALRAPVDLGTIFTTTEWSGAGRENHLYRPLTTTTLAVNFAVSGTSAWSYHLVNVLLHVGASILVFALGLSWGLPRYAALLAGLLFAVHPVHVEAVANVSGRKELLAADFLLVLALAHRGALTRGGWRLGLAVAALAGAVLSKETGLAGLGLVALLDLLQPDDEATRQSPGTRRMRRLALYAAYGAVAVAYLLLRSSVTGSLGVPTIPFADNPVADAGVWVRWATALALVGRGLALLVVPFRLQPDYSYPALTPVTSLLDPWLLASVAAIGILVVMAIRYRRTRPWLTLATGWYALTLLPASNLPLPVGVLFAERLLYLPSIAFCVVAGALLVRLLRPAPVGAAILIVTGLTGLFAVRSASYASVWSDDLALFSHAAALPGASSKAHQKRGEALLAGGRFAEAAAEGQWALTLYEDNSRAMIFLSDVYHRLGRAPEAAELLERALTLDPDDPDAWYGQGVLARDSGDLTAAEARWRRALQADPGHARSHSDLGTLSYMAGDRAGARAEWEAAVRADPHLAGTWYNLGLLYLDQGEPDRARAALETFLEWGAGEFPEQEARARSLLAGLG